VSDLPYTLLVNPSAGGGRTRKRLDTALAALADGGIEPRRVMTENIEHGRREARAAAERGDRVIVMSGDGLIGQVGGALAHTDTVMGIIPGGRGNDLARVLGIPADVEEAAGIVAGGETRAIDVGEANGERFLCIASCGFDSDANRIANEAKLVRGNLVYLYAALRALAAWKHARFRVVVDGDAHEVTGYSVAVGNSQAYGGGMYLLPHAELDDGRLDVFMCGRAPKLRYLRDIPKVFKGSHLDSPYVRLLRGAVIEVTADRPFDIYADGDPVGRTPATMRVARRCLKVVVPR
jgi:YegS/Rv2252/BmrU family lipid kinase